MKLKPSIIREIWEDEMTFAYEFDSDNEIRT
jgi:hypothetical protein